MNSYVVKAAGWRWRGSQPLLPALDVELTERCQNNCLHCCINLPSDDPAAKRELSTAQLQAILQEAAGLGCLQVRFTGGEPLLREDFEEIYLFTRRLGMKVMLFTNARLITPPLADLLAKIPPLLPVEISVYGMTPKSYDAAARAPGAYVEFRRGVDLLLKRRVPIVLKWVVLPPNRDELDEFKLWAASLPWNDQPPNINMVFQLRNRRDAPEKNRIIRGLRVPAGKLEVHEDLNRFCRTFLGPPGDTLFPCGIGEKPCVDAYGWLQPCLNMHAPELSYNLETGTLRDALMRFFPPLRELRATRPEYLRRCARCFLKGLCENCPARAWSESGNLDTPVDYLCKIAHDQARSLGLLRDNEWGWQVEDWKNRVESLNLI